MARIVIISERDPELRVELVDVDPAEGDWDGRCTGCAWTVHKARGFFPNKDDAVAMAEVHVDHHH